MQVTFWGVRGSVPAPATTDVLRQRLMAAIRAWQARSPGDRASESGLLEDDLERWVESLPPEINALAGGNTSCVEVRCGGELFVFDLGSGVRELGQHLLRLHSPGQPTRPDSDSNAALLAGGDFAKGTGRAHIFLSHLHWDHIQGWPFFAPARLAGNEFDFYSCHADVEEALRRQQSAPHFPPQTWIEMAATRRFHHWDGAPLRVGGALVSAFELEHPSRSFAFRLEYEGRVLIYASDGALSRPPRAALETPSPPSSGSLAEFLAGADLIIADAHFSVEEEVDKANWGHSSGVTAVEWAILSGVARVALFHHAPDSGDERLEALLFRARRRAAELGRPIQGRRALEVFTAREGQTVRL